jgi:hypothetical protein
MEGHLCVGVTDLLAKSASLTAELMAARLEQVAASGSSLVSEVSATVAAGRGKVTVALSRFHTFFWSDNVPLKDCLTRWIPGMAFNQRLGIF